MNYVQRPIRFWARGLWGDPKSGLGSAIFEQTIIGRSYLSICLILDTFNGGRNKLKSVFSLRTDDHQTDFLLNLTELWHEPHTMRDESKKDRHRECPPKVNLRRRSLLKAKQRLFVLGRGRSPLIKQFSADATISDNLSTTFPGFPAPVKLSRECCKDENFF